MLPTVTVQPVDALDLGRLSEAAVYFPKTRWVINPRQFAQLVTTAGWDVIHRLLDLDTVHFIIEPSSIGSQRAQDLISVVGFRLAPAAGRGWPIEEEVERAIRRRLGYTRESKTEFDRLAQRLIFESEDELFPGSTEKLLADRDVTTRVATALAKFHGVEPGTFFELEPSTSELLGSSFRFHTDFKVRADGQTPDDGLSSSAFEPDLVLRTIASMNREILRSADGKTDLWLQMNESVALSATAELIAERAAQSRRQIDLFEEVIFDKRSIATSVNLGERSLADVVDLLAHPDTIRWKGWLAKQKADAQIIREYDAAVFRPRTKWSGLVSQPGRLVVMGLVAAGSSVLTSGFSLIQSAAFAAGEKLVSSLAGPVIERLGREWQPSQWVDGPAKKFLMGGSR